MNKRARILVFVPYYLPGYKAGGPIRTLANITEHLGDDFVFCILTTDRDLGDQNPYPDIAYDKWHQVGKAKIKYLSPLQQSITSLCGLLREEDYDLIYLNSFFSTYSRKVLLLRRLGLIPYKPVILAPRGEFSAGALEIKAFKKYIYLKMMKFIHLTHGIMWQASSQHEKDDILKAFHGTVDSQSVFVAPNLPASLPSVPRSMEKATKQSGKARIVFLSRIARKKNLLFALRCLHHVIGDVKFDIYGPIEDKSYWYECQSVIESLPDRVQVSYQGAVAPEKVDAIFRRYHLFLFPTLGENFGHVILESLRAGCPVLISDQTPWGGLTERNAGWEVQLSDIEKFHRILNELILMDESQFTFWSEGARDYGMTFAKDPSLIEVNRELFLRAL
jgi:glycosyltransferase involved in cell wall biosynthesis